MKSCLVVLALACVGLCVKQYTIPVIFMHGLGGSEQDGEVLGYLIQTQHPGQPYYSLPVDDGDDSFQSLFTQFKDVQSYIQSLIDAHPDEFANGFHLVGHSQGGIITRSIVEGCDNFNIRNYVSLAGVQAGVYGHCENFGGDCEAVTERFYSEEMRNSYSIAQYWRSPNRDTYLNGNGFLPYLNNEFGTLPSFKNNTIRLKHMYLLASESDEIIVPWQASLMAFFDTDGQSIVPMEKQLYYVQDTFGLRTLDESGRLTVRNIPGVSHVDWVRDADTISQYVLPLLED